MALVLLGLAALTVAEAVHFDGQIDRAVRLVPDADPDEVAGERQGNVAMTLILGVPAVLLAVWLAATAVPLRRGVNVARILVFVASGGQLLICFAQCRSGGPAWVMPVPTDAPTGYGYPTAPLVPGFLPPNQPLPPGYLICPEPAAHLTPGAPGTSPGPTGPPAAPPDDLPDHLH
ncbi:hypothetical protein AB0B94_03275 [Micromonospora sp. NPDC048986]|uniref:hypothetical protein n=1 Tax=Micromonospora sp. NPDC048986 TaxID=3155644 RepID=UPI00340B9652